MSGGSMDYLHMKVQDAEFSEGTESRRMFRQHLDLVARTLRAIEWNDSGDGDDDEGILIDACLNGGLLDKLRAVIARQSELIMILMNGEPIRVLEKSLYGKKD